MIELRLEHSTIKVRQLVEDYRAGRIVIPEFQREYVWKRRRSVKLVDSLYRRYPISSLLLWATAEEARPRDRAVALSRLGPTNWLIDGQQRVITLSRSIAGDEGIDVVFCPDTREFALTRGAHDSGPSWFRLSHILNDELYFELRRRLDGSRAESREHEFERVRQILDYEIPVVRMVNHPFEDAVSAFSRINTLGVKLKKADIESAQIAARHAGFIADTVAPFLQRLRRDGFARLNVMHLFRVCAFVAVPDLRRRTPLHELDTKAVLSAWRKVEQAAEAVVALLRDEFDLGDMDILWSGALMVPPMALYATQSPTPEMRKAIAAWMATAALFHRYSRSVESNLDQDLRACWMADPIGALLTNIRRDEKSIQAIENDFEGTFADRGALFGAYVASRQQRLRIAIPGFTAIRKDNRERYPIVPREWLPSTRRSIADSVANALFASREIFARIRVNADGMDFSRLPRNELAARCIPADESLWLRRRAEAFLEERKTLLAEAFNTYLKTNLPSRRVGGHVG
jgi:hypothetical protein